MVDENDVANIDRYVENVRDLRSRNPTRALGLKPANPGFQLVSPPGACPLRSNLKRLSKEVMR